MKNFLLFLFLFSGVFAQASDGKQVVGKDVEWRIGGKIHFEEENGLDYIGLKEINSIAKEVLKKSFDIQVDTCSPNAKIMLKFGKDAVIMTHYEEKSRPGIGEEMHATLLYTSPRGFCGSETLKQVCKTLFEECDFPPGIESVARAYGSIIKPEWKFKIEEVAVRKSSCGSTFITTKLLFDGRENLYKGNEPISAGLHLTLVNMESSVLLTDEARSQLTQELNGSLQNKYIKIADKEGVADLEFGMSGSSERLRAIAK